MGLPTTITKLNIQGVGTNKLKTLMDKTKYLTLQDSRHQELGEYDQRTGQI